MPHIKESFISNLSLFMLFLTTGVHAEPNTLPQQVNQPQAQSQDLQTQLKDANARISALETNWNSASHDLKTLTNSAQSNEANTGAKRSANGHGRW